VGISVTDFSPLAWELARRATFEIDQVRDRPWCATVPTIDGPVKAWGHTHTGAMRQLAEGLDMWQRDREKTEAGDVCPTCGEPGCM
jgi:hypothetical protein